MGTLGTILSILAALIVGLVIGFLSRNGILNGI